MPIESGPRKVRRKIVLGHTPLLRRFLPDCQRTLSIKLLQDTRGRPIDSRAEAQRLQEEKKSENWKRMNWTAKKDGDKKNTGRDGPSAANTKFSSETYAEIVHGAKRRAKMLMSAYARKREQLQADIQSERRELRREQAALTEQCNEIRHNDAHEYSNFIVSKLALGKKK